MKDKRTKILLVSNYYPPEKGAAPNRIQTLAENLSLHNYAVTVICPLPNYPTGSVFKGYKRNKQNNYQSVDTVNKFAGKKST